MQAISSRLKARAYWRSSSFQMALLFTVLLGTCALILGYFSYYFNRDNFLLDAEKVLDTQIAYLAHGDRAALASAVANDIGGQEIYLLRDGQGNFIAGNMTKLPQEVTVLKEGMLLFEYQSRDYAAKVHQFDDMRTLLVGTDVTDTARSYRLMKWLSILSIVFMAVVVLISFLISGFVVSRTNRVAITAKTIMDTGDLSQRIAVDSRWDDLSSMTFVLNAFLARVERLMIGIRQVSDNIAHDLRTPLTRLHNMLEQLKSDPALAADARAGALCDEALAETGHLLSTFGALLRIAHLEAGKQRQNFAPVDIGRILRDVAEFYDPLAQQKNITLRYEEQGGGDYAGDRDLLFQAFANLLDNAIKFTPEGGRITLKLEARDDALAVSVCDSGPGISDADKPKVFDRFYRADASRSTEGNGLGLALVAAIVALHEGAISLHDGTPGLRVEVLLRHIKLL